MGSIPEHVRAERKQQTLSVDISSQGTICLPIALKVAWSAVLGCYIGSNTVSFDVVHDDGTVGGTDQALASSTVKFHLQRNDSVQLAMEKMSQVASPAYGRPSDTLLVLRVDATTCHPAAENGHRPEHFTYHLALYCSMAEKHLFLQAVYNESRWSSATVYFMLHQIRHAMHQMAASLSVPVAALQSISAEGQKQLMAWDPSQRRATRNETVWQAIQERCGQQPLKMAIESWDGRVTYAELEQRVSAVAEKLEQLSLGPGAFIGLLLERSMLSTIVVLGVIKAGCAFVLLDASQPSPRLKTMCALTAVTTVIATKKHTEVGALLGITLLSTDEFPILPSGVTSHTHAQPSGQLYAGFTSGSTGEPKGFIITHGNFMSGLDEYCAAVNLNSDSRAFQFASFSFVVSITGQLAPLTRGACLCIPSQRQLEHDLACAIRELRADWIAITPSAARILDSASVPSLKTMVMVGEEMASSDLARWGHLNLCSLYGQSENSKGTMIARKTGREVVAGIGTPYHANAWVVDPKDHNILQPIGAEGELVIESPCLTSGYIDNKSQTEASFVTNPEWVRELWRRDDVCIFKTGDLARRSADDGSFQLLGRKGTRIKLRGQRVELGEVEHQIRLHFPVVKSVAVDVLCTAEDTLEESPMLVAFILMKTRCGSDQDRSLLAKPTTEFQEQTLVLAASLKEALPSFMIPTAYVELAVLPKTGTGKLDRRRMREAAAALTRRELVGYSVPRTVYVAPRFEEEAILQDLCERILQLPQGHVGMNDTFVDLGGDSLMARHLITGARSRGLSISLQQVFQPATLATMAQTARAMKRCETALELGDLEDFAELRGDFMGNLPESLDKYNVEDVLPTLELQAAYASKLVVDCFPLHISGSVDVMQLHRACESLVATHAILRTVFHSFCGRLVQVVLRELDLPFLKQECVSWDAALQWVEQYGSDEMKKRYDIGKSVVGFVLVTVPSETRQILIMRLSHGQYDGLCLRPLIQDLWAAYQGVLLVNTEFKTHVHDCIRLQTSETYNLWRGILQGSRSPSLFQPVPAADDMATLSLTTKGLPTVRPLAGTTAASMIKAAWFEALWHETGQDDLVFGQFLHAWTGNQGVVGPCMNVIPVRVQKPHWWTRRQVVQAIQEQHAETASADALGWHDIVSNCTDWPAGTEVDSVVLHQNFDRDIQVRCSDIVCRKDTPILSHWAVFPMLLVTHPRESKLDALLLTSSRYQGLRDPVSMLNNFARALEMLESHPDEPF
ncbi:hypothetical protein NQ176_g5494 [Zarea fungicola]|uniref:Uncharacterized protein n=1 Tax=Zarea fungicola TaxID=93591 RepID=A0ACC1NAM3_9HYPO|nr:hypothetical protein NQ176_g5494 [Lecanicillium fungicola]